MLQFVIENEIQVLEPTYDGNLTVAIQLCRYLTIRHRCAVMRGVAESTSVAEAGLHSLSATALALGLHESNTTNIQLLTFLTTEHTVNTFLQSTVLPPCAKVHFT